MTWKADGTRYLILILKCGTYLIDRAGEVRDVMMCIAGLAVHVILPWRTFNILAGAEHAQHAGSE